MNRTHKPGFDEYGWPLYDAAWYWRLAIRPALLVLAGLLAVVAAVDAIL